MREKTKPQAAAAITEMYKSLKTDNKKEDEQLESRIWLNFVLLPEDTRL